MNGLIVRIFEFFDKNRWLLWLCLVATVGVLVFSVCKVNFVEDISTFLPNSTDSRQINEAYRKIAASDKIIVTISATTEATDETELIDAAAYFAQTLQENDTAHHIKELLYEIDNEQITKTTDFVQQNLPLYLTETDYTLIDSLIKPNNIENRLVATKNLLLSPMGTFMQVILKNDPLMFSQKALKDLEVFRQNDNYNTDNGFIFNDKGECIITITSAYPSSETANNKLLADEIYKTVYQTKKEFEGKVRIVPFGAALISITNAERIKNDSLLAVSISGVLILLILILFFRSPKPLLLIVLSISFGALFSLGAIVFFKSTVSIIAIGIASIIFGIAINYPLHFLVHFKHTGQRLQTIKELINPLLIGNITTVGAFLSLLLISSEAMHDLGLFSALLLVGTIMFVLIFLPHTLSDKPHIQATNNNQTYHKSAIKSFLNGITNFLPENHKILVICFIAITIVLLIFSSGAQFDANMQNINYMTDEQRSAMNKFIAESNGRQTLYLVAEGATRDEALDNYSRQISAKLNDNNPLTHDTTHIRITGIGNFFPTERSQVQKIERWNTFWATRKDTFIKNFEQIAAKQGFRPEAFAGFYTILNKEYKTRNFEYFYDNLKPLAENYIYSDSTKTFIFTLLQGNNIDKKRLDDIASPYTYVFDNSSFTQKMVTALSDDFNKVLYICGLIVFVFLFFSFGRVEIAAITFVPLAVGWVWILGLMSIFDIKFNIVNIILATFIFGQGDDYTIFITEGLIHEYTYGRKMLANVKKSILLSATILLIAVGSLIFAKHPAMHSLAELTIIGMATVVLCAYMLPPLIYKWLVYSKGKKRIMPITLWNIGKTAFSFTVFVVTAVCMSLIGFVLLTIGGKTKRHKELFHRILCKCFRVLAAVIPEIKHRVDNPHGETFEKPSIIVSNHQSHLDLLYTLLLSPKIIVLTNRWVWRNPFYGIIIRYADFVPVVDGIEDNIDKLRQFTDNGYSILVFPEGSRSADCSIGRFRKGAFYLAHKLNLDIIPVLIHGVGHVLPKQEFMLRKGEVNIEIGKRLNIKNIPTHTHSTQKIDSSTTDELYLNDVAKYFRQLYRIKYEDIARRIETPDYFADKVLKNYIYKGNSIAHNARKKLRNNNNFKNIIAQMPDTGKVLITNCGQGELPLIAALVKKQLTIVATDNNPDILDIARNCASVPQNLDYRSNIGDVTEFDLIIDCQTI